MPLGPGNPGRSCVSGIPHFGNCKPALELLGLEGCSGDAYCQPVDCLSQPLEGIVDGACSPYRGEGSTCDSEQLTRTLTDCAVCQAGLRCLNDPTTRDQRCRKPCADASDCPCESVCLEDGFCITCKDDGEACGYTGKPDSGECCEEGSICGAVEGSLSGRCCKALGVTCSADSDCCDGSLCDGDSGTCVPCGFTGDDCEEQDCCSATAVCMGAADARTCCSPDDKEICDGIDNNCDGQIDEGFNLGAECWGVGACAVGGPGVIECDGKGGTRCSVDPGGSQDRSSLEICDGIDNDCDGQIDEGLDGQIRTVPGGCTDTTFAAAPHICGRPMEGSRERCVAGEGWKCLAQAEYDFCTAWGDGPNMWPCGGLEDYECGTSTHHPICAPNLTCLFRNNKFLCTRTPVCGEAHPPRCWLPENTGGDPTCFYGE